MDAISFFVNGDPKPQPRHRSFAVKMGESWTSRSYDPGTAEGWKALISIAAKPFTPASPLAGPVRLDLAFFFARPKSHFKTGRMAGQLRIGIPHWFTAGMRHDRDNLDKAVMDCLTRLGFWHDDGQVCAGEIQKIYGGRPGCQITIRSLAEYEAAQQAIVTTGELNLA